jgi:hypothetical protein
LQRSNKKAADKINTIRRAVLRGRPLWDKVFQLSTQRKSFPGGTSYVLNVKAGRNTTPEERDAAGDLAIALTAGRVVVNDDSAAGPEGGTAPVAEPDAKGGLAV